MAMDTPGGPGDPCPAHQGRRYLFKTFPASRSSLALEPAWNQMTHLKQLQLRPGATYLEGAAAPQGTLPGGQVQMFMIDLGDLL